MQVFLRISLCLCFCSILQSSFAQQNQQRVRRAFVLGENEETYDQLRETYARTLLTVCKDDHERAFASWITLMNALERYAEKIDDIDLNGVKLYLNVFWNEDGSIAHFGFLPMPNSKNVKIENMVAFFSAFTRQYVPNPDLVSDKKFSHYTSVAFPTVGYRKSN